MFMVLSIWKQAFFTVFLLFFKMGLLSSVVLQKKLMRWSRSLLGKLGGFGNWSSWTLVRLLSTWASVLCRKDDKCWDWRSLGTSLLSSIPCRFVLDSFLGFKSLYGGKELPFRILFRRYWCPLFWLEKERLQFWQEIFLLWAKRQAQHHLLTQFSCIISGRIKEGWINLKLGVPKKLDLST